MVWWRATWSIDTVSLYLAHRELLSAAASDVAQRLGWPFAGPRWAGVGGFLASLTFLLIYLPKGRNAEIEVGVAARRSVALLSAAVLVATILLYACVVAWPEQQVWLAAAFSLQLLHCIWMFVRLLGRSS